MKNTVDCGGGEEEERDLGSLTERTESLSICRGQGLGIRCDWGCLCRGHLWDVEVWPLMECSQTSSSNLDGTPKKSGYQIDWIWKMKKSFLLYEFVNWYSELLPIQTTTSTAIDWMFELFQNSYVEPWSPIWWYLEEGHWGGNLVMRTELLWMGLLLLLKDLEELPYPSHHMLIRTHQKDSCLSTRNLSFLREQTWQSLALGLPRL